MQTGFRILLTCLFLLLTGVFLIANAQQGGLSGRLGSGAL